MTAQPCFAVAAAVCIAGTCLAQTDPRHFATYFGGDGKDTAAVVAAAPNGDVVIAGHGNSTVLPVTAGAFQPNRAGVDDVFIARLSADCSQVLACTWLGGASTDHVYQIRVAQDNSIWVCGDTRSSNFPVTPGAFSGPIQRRDAFVAHLDRGLTSLLYSTAFGNLNSVTGQAFAIDEQNQLIYLTGITGAANVATTASAFRGTLGGIDAYLAVFDISVPGQTTLAYGTYLGGTGAEIEVNDLSVDANGIVSVTGTTLSTDLPVTPGAVQPTILGTQSGFVQCIDPNQAGAAGLKYASYFGGSGADESLQHVVDANGVLHLLLISPSPNLPTTPNALLSTSNAGLDAFYAQIDPALSGSLGLRYGSWIAAGSTTEGQSSGNPAHNVGAAIALGPSGIAVALTTGSSTGLSSTPGALQASKAGMRGHVILLDVVSGPDPVVAYATHYFGCSGTLFATGVAFHPSGDLLFTGGARAVPVTPGAAQTQPATNGEGFVTRLEPTPWPSAFQSFGTACPGTAGTPTLAGVGKPAICGALQLQATGLPTGQIGALYFGRTNNWGGFQLPLSLGAVRCAWVLCARGTQRRGRAADRIRHRERQLAGAAAAGVGRADRERAVSLLRPRCERTGRGDHQRPRGDRSLVATPRPIALDLIRERGLFCCRRPDAPTPPMSTSSPQDRDRVEQLVFQCLEADDTEAALAEVDHAHPELAPRVHAALAKIQELTFCNDTQDGDASLPRRLGPFELIARIGSGGMGVVYSARDLELDRDVAVKLIRPDQHGLDDSRRRFRREVAAVARLQPPRHRRHPHGRRRRWRTVLQHGAGRRRVARRTAA